LQNYKDFFVQQNETIRIMLDTEQWVDIKAEMSVGDYEKYESGLLQAEVESQVASTEGLGRRSNRKANPTKMSMSAGNVSLMQLNIVGWSFEGVRPQPSTIRALKFRWQSKIITAIEEANSNSPLPVKESQQTLS
jgi:hypothetical protein